MRRALTLTLALLALTPATALRAQTVEPVDDLLELAVEDIVGPLVMPDASHVPEVRELAEAARADLLAGRMGEARRKYARARTLLHGREWDAVTEFVSSLSLRPARVAIDPQEALPLAIGQHYPAPFPQDSAGPAITLKLAARRWSKGRTPGERVVDLGETLLTDPDLVEQPHYLILDPANLPDGNLELVADVLRGKERLGTVSTRIFVARGLRRDLDRLRQGLQSLEVRNGLAASMAYPLDLAKTLDLRQRNVRDIDLRKELDAALELMSAARRGEDPSWQARGLVERHYRSPVSGRIEPYQLFVPESWDGASSLPLVVMLHGSMGDEDSVFASGKLEALARERGVALLSPMGDDPNSVWGNRLPAVLADGTTPSPRPVVANGRVQPVARLESEPAEADVAATMALVRAEFPIDPRRIYLAGNSMGGEGTWHLAMKWPDRWAAIAPGAGPIDPGLLDFDTLSNIPTLVVHGRHDPITSFAASEDTVRRLRAAGGEVRLLAPEEGHDAFGENLGAILDFLLDHSRTAATEAQDHDTR